MEAGATPTLKVVSGLESEAEACRITPTAFPAQQHAVGTHVEYYSQTLDHWIPAVVQGFDNANGSYDLNVQPVAPPQKVRAHGTRKRLPEGSAAEYHSATLGRWIPAVVKGFAEETGTYVLDIQPAAPFHAVRASIGTPSARAATSAKSLSSMDCPAAMSSSLSLQGQHSSDRAKAAEDAQQQSKMDEEAARALQEELAKEDAGGSSENQFDCPLCLLSHDREEGIEMDCQHRLCVTCFHAYLQSKITDAQVGEDELVCPIPGCKTEITVAQVEGGTHGTELWDKFLSFRLKMWAPVKEDGVMVECPTLACGRFVVPDGLQKVRCPVCTKEFCPKCMEDHSGISCEAFQAWKAENSKADQNFEDLMANEGWRRCPKCRAPSERESGCNFMQCRSAICRKHTFWCYVCGKEVPKEEHYSHYPKGPYEDECNTPEAERLVPARAQPASAQPASAQPAKDNSFGAAVDEAVAAVGDAVRGWFNTALAAG